MTKTIKNNDISKEDIRILSKTFRNRRSFYSTMPKVNPTQTQNKYNITESVYVIASVFGWKIGISKKPFSRTKTIISGVPFDAKVVLIHWAKDMRQTEKLLHQKYSPRHIKGEWFDLNENDLPVIDSFIKEQNKKQIEEQQKHYT